jgi:hypothetical protein
MGKTPREILFGPNRVMISMDTNQAGATMASRYSTAKHAAIIGASVFPVGILAKGGSAVTGSKAYKIYGAIKRPILTLGVHKKIHGARTAMTLSKSYAKMVLASSVFQLGRNIQLAHAKEYKRLGINIYGPPGSLFLYDNYMDRNKTSEDEKFVVAKEKSRVGGSLPSKPKTRGKDSYRPAERKIDAFINGHIPNYNPCKKGYRFDLKKKLCIKV